MNGGTLRASHLILTYADYSELGSHVDRVLLLFLLNGMDEIAFAVRRTIDSSHSGQLARTRALIAFGAIAILLQELQLLTLFSVGRKGLQVFEKRYSCEILGSHRTQWYKLSLRRLYEDRCIL